MQTRFPAKIAFTLNMMLFLFVCQTYAKDVGELRGQPVQINEANYLIYLSPGRSSLKVNGGRDPLTIPKLAVKLIDTATRRSTDFLGANVQLMRRSISHSRLTLPASSCDAVFNSDVVKNGSISSPSYPAPYPPRSHCRYDFQGRGRERVQVVFSDFNLYHPTDDSKECESVDTLIAFVHIDGRMEKIDAFCGSAMPKPVMSNGPRLMLEFRGIYSSRYSRGFKATYSFTENFGVTTGRQLSEYPCAFVYNSSESRNGTFSSPNYPGFYPRDTECHYFFYGNQNEKVHLHFSYFDVEGVSPCEAISASDYVEFSNYITRDRKYSRHCGQMKEFDIESDRKFFRVTFRSNDRLDGTGFKATYRFMDEVDTYTTKPDQNNNASYISGNNTSLLLSILAILLLRTIRTIKE
ncbi:Sol1 [Carabus blaptoides fortunei]